MAITKAPTVAQQLAQAVEQVRRYRLPARLPVPQLPGILTADTAVVGSVAHQPDTSGHWVRDSSQSLPKALEPTPRFVAANPPIAPANAGHDSHIKHPAGEPVMPCGDEVIYDRVFESPITTMLNWDPTNALTTSVDVTYFPKLYDRIPAGAEYDFAVVSLGTNSIGAALNDFVAQVQNINAYIRTTLGIDTIWWTTITPRGYPNGSHNGSTVVAGYLNANVAAGATSFTSTTQLGTGTTQVGLGANWEDVTISSVTGTGPYTCNTGAFVNAHYSGEPCSQGNERSRRYWNNHLRNLPDGIAGVFDFERLVEKTPGSYDCDPRLVSSDYLHFVRGANIEKARAVVSAGVQPLFG